jgi:type II secretory pathway pseudopilin PulG
MKLPFSNIADPGYAESSAAASCRPGLRWKLRRGKLPIASGKSAVRNDGGFTMIEIALCLAIIGFALVSILLVLPSGMNTQRETREETIVGQDATMLMEAIRDGSRGNDDLTNYVYAITNYWAFYDNTGARKFLGQNGYTYNSSSIAANWPQKPITTFPINTGLRIIGLLSTPEYTDGFMPITNLYSGGYSNHVVAYVRSFSGLAAEKPPQDNPIMQGDTFSYRVLCVNAPMAADTNMLFQSGFARQLIGNLRELRMLFEWPQLPSGNLGPYRQPFRATIGGQIYVTNEILVNSYQNLYFYQSQSFTNTP